MSKPCQTCGGPIPPGSQHTRRYCSADCKHEAWDTVAKARTAIRLASVDSSEDARRARLEAKAATHADLLTADGTWPADQALRRARAALGLSRRFPTAPVHSPRMEIDL